MQIQDKIDAYVKNRLLPEEKTAFERELAQDPELRAAVAQARLDLEVGNLLIRDEVRGWMSKWSDSDDWPELQQAAPSTPHPPLFRAQFYRWMAVAAVLILAPVAYWFFYKQENAENLAFSEKKNEPAQAPNRPQVAAQDSSAGIATPAKKMQRNPVQPTRTTDARLIAMAESGFQYRNAEIFLRGSESGRSANEQDALSRAAEALRNHQWCAAVRIAEAVPASDPQYADARLLLGQVFFEQKQYAAATQSIQQAIQTGKIPLDPANWNLLMTLVAQYGARKQEADQLLRAILNDPENPFLEDARALYEALNR